ncbi:hypothetical protein GCG21_11960 [Pseudactinotalea sp. HY160]|uniref:glycosyltransferase family 4 protein n=1 Tax=Pseudactinotalea sp. HY160 TaxID=2654490 RepID=UPI00128C19D8|nr:glycosyltransferase family 4 protein [Pseudactinotalea sp. HY160]MPV50707.1 hypothetical protein [Pseudactinotalea sp. HY160]
MAELDALVRSREYLEGRAVAATLSGCGNDLRAVAAALLAAIDLSDEGRRPREPAALVAGALDAADMWWGVGDAVSATYALSAALRLLFHPDRHADVDDPPLARDPDGFLASLRASSMMGELLDRHTPAGVRHRDHGQAGSATPAPPGTHDAGRMRVLVLTGAYPRFAEPLVAALAADGDLDVHSINLGETDRRFNWLGVNTDALSWRVAAHHRGAQAMTIGGDPGRNAALLAGYDAVVADWGDRSAMWASTWVPHGTRLVVRLHGMDLFSPWVHLIDWDRVDDLICVSEPFRDLARRVLGQRLRGVRVHAIEHGVAGERFALPKRAGSEHTVGMIGWGKIVKDPVWALTVLSILREHDRRWRLLLVGHRLVPNSARSAAYAERFEQLLETDLAGAVEFVPQTDDVPAAASRMGYVLSASRRESFHLAVVEGALSGAVPVVRDWPVYATGAGPRALYPEEWIVDDPAEAAARILSLADPEDRRVAGEHARADARERFDPALFARRVRAVVASGVGRPSAGARG